MTTVSLPRHHTNLTDSDLSRLGFLFPACEGLYDRLAVLPRGWTSAATPAAEHGVRGFDSATTGAACVS